MKTTATIEYERVVFGKTGGCTLYDERGEVARFSFVPRGVLRDYQKLLIEMHKEKLVEGSLAREMIVALFSIARAGMYRSEAISASNFLTKYVPSAYDFLEKCYIATTNHYVHILDLTEHCFSSDVLETTSKLVKPQERWQECKGAFDCYRR